MKNGVTVRACMNSNKMDDGNFLWTWYILNAIIKSVRI